MMRTVSRTAALGLTLLATLALSACMSSGNSGGQATPSVTATTPSATATSAPPTTAPPTPATTTVITLGLPYCDLCTVYANNSGTATAPSTHPFQVSGVVHQAVATLTVPTKQTAGMWFSVSCSGDICNSSNAAPVLVIQYKGQAPGATVPDSAAATTPLASGCWAGTTLAKINLPFIMTIFPDTILGRHSHSIRAWADPQLQAVSNTWLKTWHGGLGTQSQVTC